MKQTIIGIIIGLALGGVVTWTLLNRHEHGEEKGSWKFSVGIFIGERGRG